MARGWESKSVEEQQSEFAKGSAAGKKPATPEEKQRAQQVEALRLSRANVVSRLDSAQSDRHKELLEKELQYLDSEIARLLAKS
jgi:hypothetical protein